MIRSSLSLPWVPWGSRISDALYPAQQPAACRPAGAVLLVRRRLEIEWVP